MNHAPHLYFAWQQLVEKSQLMLRLATEEQWDELIASEMAYVNAVQESAYGDQGGFVLAPQDNLF